MANVQLVEPKLSVSGVIGLCLDYARRVFSAPAGTPTAWKAWLNAQYKHSDAIPGDVSVVLWFSYIVGGVNLGHVAINVPNKGIYSSPWQEGTTHAVLTSVAQLEKIYGVAYVGWSEDINGVRVMSEQEEAVPNQGDVINAYLQANNRQPTPEEIEVYINKPWGAADGLYYGKVVIDWANAQKAAANPPTPGFKPLGQEVYIKS